MRARPRCCWWWTPWCVRNSCWRSKCAPPSTSFVAKPWTSASSHRPRAASAEAGRLQVIVGLDDLAQAILAGAVAAIGVGMMPLHQELEARLDVGLLRVGIETERVQRLAL